MNFSTQDLDSPDSSSTKVTPISEPEIMSKYVELNYECVDHQMIEDSSMDIEINTNIEEDTKTPVQTGQQCSELCCMFLC